MPASGEGKAGVLIIAEAPGKTEDEKGVQLIGEAGSLLRDILTNDLRVDLDRDCRKTNAVNCRPPKNRVPTQKEIEACHPRILQEIKEHDPRIIVTLGLPALQSILLGSNWPAGEVSSLAKWRGWSIPDQRLGRWVVPTYHPSYLLRNINNLALERIIVGDLRKAFALREVPLPNYSDLPSRVRVIDGGGLEEVLLTILLHLPLRRRVLSFDYETTGLKPYAPGHEILYASVCWDPDQAYAFRMPQKGSRAWNLWWRILDDERILKTSHNMKFEHLWSQVILGVKVQGWHYCSLLGSHVLNNASGVTGLKFQSYVNFGVDDYSTRVKPYMKSVDGTAVGLNRLREAPADEVLLYCGMDSLLQQMLMRDHCAAWKEQNL